MLRTTLLRTTICSRQYQNHTKRAASCAWLFSSTFPRYVHDETKQKKKDFQKLKTINSNNNASGGKKMLNDFSTDNSTNRNNVNQYQSSSRKHSETGRYINNTIIYCNTTSIVSISI